MTLAPERLTATEEDIDGVMDAVRAYVEGWINGDPEHHARAYHPECVKRRLEIDEPSGVTVVDLATPTAMVEYAATGRSVIEDCEYDVVIDAISEDISSVRLYSCRWVDFLHLFKARGEWRLLHVTWHHRKEG